VSHAIGHGRVPPVGRLAPGIAHGPLPVGAHLGEARPARRRPIQLPQTEGRSAHRVAVVEVVAEEILAAVGQPFEVARAKLPAVVIEEHRAAAVAEIDAVLVVERTGRARAPANPDLVGAVDSRATAAGVDKQVEVLALMHERGGLERAAPAATSGVVGHHRADGTAQRLARRRVEFGHHDARRVGAPAHPDPVAIDEHARVDCVEGGRVGGWARAPGRVGLNHLASVGPVGVYERRRGGDPDRRVDRAPGGDGVIEMVALIEIGDVGCPEDALEAGHRLGGPGRQRGEHRPAGRPAIEIGRGAGDDALAGGEVGVDRAVLDDGRGVVGAEFARELAMTGGGEPATEDQDGREDGAGLCGSRSPSRGALKRRHLVGRGHPCPIAGRSLRPSWAPLSPCRPRFAILGSACRQGRLRGTGDPDLRPGLGSDLAENVIRHGDDNGRCPGLFPVRE
jgi:hypothetical protein